MIAEKTFGPQHPDVAGILASLAMGFLQEEEKGGQRSSVSGRRDIDLLSQAQPLDLIKFGFIPEFIGRLPIIVTLHHLDQQDIVRILTEPKNALVKQYQKFFNLDNVELVFEKGSLDAIAELALLRGRGRCGARLGHGRVRGLSSG